MKLLIKLAAVERNVVWLGLGVGEGGWIILE